MTHIHIYMIYIYHMICILYHMICISHIYMIYLNSLLSFLLLMFKFIPLWPVGTSISWLLIWFHVNLLVFDSFLAFWIDKILPVLFWVLLAFNINNSLLQIGLVSFKEKWYLETTMWNLRVLNPARLVTHCSVNILNNRPWEKLKKSINLNDNFRSNLILLSFDFIFIFYIKIRFVRTLT